METLQNDNARLAADIETLANVQTAIGGYIKAQGAEIASLKAQQVDTSGLESNLNKLEAQIGTLGTLAPAAPVTPPADATGITT